MSDERFAPPRALLLYASHVVPSAAIAWFAVFIVMLVLGPTAAALGASVVALLLIGRALMCSVTVGPTTVRVRNLLRTDEVPLSSIRAVRVASLHRWTEVPRLSVLVVKQNGEERRVRVAATTSVHDDGRSIQAFEHLLSAHAGGR